MPAPTPCRLFFFYLAVALALFLRPPTTNFIFDEQEALLANPYLWGDGSFLSAFEVDFWGRPFKTTIGSYRPLPNLLWRLFSFSLKWRTPWLFHLLNIAFHAGTAAVLARSLFLFFKDRGEHAAKAAWFGGALFVVLALSTEAVCSVVGLADILVGFSSAWCLWILVHFARARESQEKGNSPLAVGTRMGFALFGVMLLGLLSKETMLSFLPVVPVLALLLWDGRSPTNTGRLSVGAVSGVSAALSLFAYVSLRRAFYSGSWAQIPAPTGSFPRVFGPFFRWFDQPPLPADPMNNPLLTAQVSERWTTAAEIFAKQLGQIPFPYGLSGDYSYPAEPVASFGVVPFLGGLAFVCLTALALFCTIQVLRGRGSPLMRLLGAGALWLPATYLPVSNALVLLPTIRADRLMYLPSMGAVLLGTCCFRFLHPRLSAWFPSKRVRLSFLLVFFGFQAASARYYATDYASDLVFWRRTSGRSPASAKAHLNYGVMVGARGDNRARLAHTKRAVRLAPSWPMGRVYLADSHCRLGEKKRAMQEYLPALELAAGSKALTALSLQCIWDMGAFPEHRHALMDAAYRHPDTWLDYFVHELSTDGARHQGISPQYRPRRYNERGVGMGHGASR